MEVIQHALDVLTWLLVLLFQDVFAVSPARALERPRYRIAKDKIHPSLSPDERAASRDYLDSQLFGIDDVVAIPCAHFLTLLMEDELHLTLYGGRSSFHGEKTTIISLNSIFFIYLRVVLQAIEEDL
jgi:hypothetical protein